MDEIELIALKPSEGFEVVPVVEACVMGMRSLCL
jgi:hypothetical protein